MGTVMWPDEDVSSTVFVPTSSTANYTVQVSPDPPEHVYPFKPWEAVVIAVILLGFVVGTVVGNILVCVAVCLVRKLRRPCNYLLVSLAVSDLCVATLVMPMALVNEVVGEWRFGPVMCDVWVSFDVLSCTASILNLCMISVDRYYAITKPLEYGVKRTPRRMIICVSIVWLSAACISVPPLLIMGNEHGTGRDCIVCQNFWYQIYATLGSFYIPMAVMITVYYKIFKAAKRIVGEEKRAQAHFNKLRAKEAELGSPEKVYAVTEIGRNGTAAETKTMVQNSHYPRKWLDSYENNHRKDSKCALTSAAAAVAAVSGDADVHKNRKSPMSRSKLRFVLAKERKASTTLGIIMSAFTVCWLPFFVLALVRPFISDPEAIPHSLSSLFLWLGYANSLLNPIIYATLNKDFRKPFREILCFRCNSLNVMMREEFYHSHYGDPDSLQQPAPVHLNAVPVRQRVSNEASKPPPDVVRADEANPTPPDCIQQSFSLNLPDKLHHSRQQDNNCPTTLCGPQRESFL